MKPAPGISIVSGSNGRVGDSVMRRFAGRFREVDGFDREALSYNELQHTISRLIRGTEMETIDIPSALTPPAKPGAWVLDHLPGREVFVKPWMIDRANDHYALDITRARTLLGWGPKRSVHETPLKMVAALEADRLGWYRENELEPPSRLEEERSKPT